MSTNRANDESEPAPPDRRQHERRKIGRPCTIVGPTRLNLWVSAELYDRVIAYSKARHRGNVSDAGRELLEDALHHFRTQKTQQQA